MSSRSVRSSALLVLSLVLGAGPAVSQQTPGAVTGHALAAADGAPIPLSLVRLAPAGGGEGRTVLTDAGGAFRFDSVAPGAYRLRVDRIGYDAAPSPQFAVPAGETVDRPLRAGERPVAIQAITAVANRCVTGAGLAGEPELAALWTEARKAAETRRQFQRQYAYRANMRLQFVGHVRIFHDKVVDRDSVVETTPDSVRVREARRRAMRGREGYVHQTRNSLLLSLPDEMELLEDDFLVGHCLFADPAPTADGAWALRFRPVSTTDGRSDIRGTILIDTASFAVRQIAFDYLSGPHAWGRGTLSYAPTATPFGTVRLPAGGALHGDPRGMIGLFVSNFQGTIAFRDYRDFRRVPGAD
jgi:hypothetical protein